MEPLSVLAFMASTEYWNPNLPPSTNMFSSRCLDLPLAALQTSTMAPSSNFPAIMGRVSKLANLNYMDFRFNSKHTLNTPWFYQQLNVAIFFGDLAVASQTRCEHHRLISQVVLPCWCSKGHTGFPGVQWWSPMLRHPHHKIQPETNVGPAARYLSWRLLQKRGHLVCGIVT